MPTYDYKCDACGHAFEQFQSMTATPIRKCPKCKKSKVKRLIGTGAGLIFKGSGFYITDYRDQSYKDKAKADSGATTSGNGDAKSSETKTDSGSTSTDSAKPAATESKPAAASEPKPAAPAKSEKKPSGKKK
jgi:putative FmdB family regulatory protein